MSPEKKYFAPRSPGTLIHMLSSNFVSLIASIMSHKYSLTRNPTPPAPLFLLSCPFFFFPIHAYSPTLHPISPPLSHMTLEFPLYLGHAYLLVRLFLAFSVLPWRIHIRSMILFSASHLFHYPVCVCLLFCSPSLLLFFSLLLSFFPFSIFGFVFVCLLYATSPPPNSLWTTHCFLPHLASVHPRAAS